MAYKETYETMLLSIEEPGIAIIKFNRPKAFNAVNAQFLDDLEEIALECCYDSQVKVIIFTGNEIAFAAGADIKAVANYNSFEARDFLDKVHRAMFAIEDNHKPTIAAVEGLALGGGLEIALACDIRIIGDNCTLGFPEMNLGIYPGGGGTQRLPRNCSLALAKQYIFTGDSFNAAMADKMGLVNQVVPTGQVLEEARKLARKLCSKAPLALREAKRSINNAMNMDIKAGCQAEQIAWSMLFASEDQKEGMKAFLENRTSNFRGQ